MFQNSGSQSGPAKGIRLSFLTQADQAKFEQLFAQSAAPYGGSKIPAQTVSELLRRSNLDNNSLAKIWDLASIANAPHLTFPEFAVAMFLTSKQLTGQALPASLPPNIREETEIAMATIESTETSQQLVNTNTPQYMNPPMMAGMQSTGMQPQVAGIRLTGMQPTGMQPQMTSMQPQMTGMPSQLPIMTGMQRPTPPPIPQLPMQTGYTSQFQAPMQTGFQPSQPSTKPRLQNLDFAKKMMPNQNGVTNLLNPSLGTKDSERISWKISPEEKQRYREIFDAWDGTGTGFMSGETAKDVLTQSQLPPEDLMKIWNLADHDNKGSLDHDEFAIAMHLVYRKMNGFEIPSVLPPELRPPSSLLKKFVIGRRPPPSTPSFGSPQHQPSREETEDYSLYNSNQHDYVSSSRRKGPQSFVSRSYASYNNDDDEEDVRVLEDLRRQISETKRQLDRMPKITTTSAYSASNKYSLEELKEKIRRAHEGLHYATKSNPLSSKYFENKETLLGLLETQKSLQDEIQYLCNRDIPVLARQLRGSAAELRDAKVRNSRKTDSSQDFMAFIQPTGPGGSITESDRVRAKAKAMMAARKAGQTGSSSDASFVLPDNVEREMEKSRTALLDMRGDLRYLEEMPASKDLQDKKRFENGQELAYELRRFIEQLDSKISEPSSYSPHTSSNFRSTSSLGGYQSPSYVASPTLSSVAASPKPKPAPARPRTAEEIKKE
ncbi:actin organization and endocytosis protein, partial [Rhizopus stolonifer]